MRLSVEYSHNIPSSDMAEYFNSFVDKVDFFPEASELWSLPSTIDPKRQLGVTVALKVVTELLRVLAAFVSEVPAIIYSLLDEPMVTCLILGDLRPAFKGLSRWVGFWQSR